MNRQVWRLLILVHIVSMSALWQWIDLIRTGIGGIFKQCKINISSLSKRTLSLRWRIIKCQTVVIDAKQTAYCVHSLNMSSIGKCRWPFLTSSFLFSSILTTIYNKSKLEFCVLHPWSRQCSRYWGCCNVVCFVACLEVTVFKTSSRNNWM